MPCHARKPKRHVEKRNEMATRTARCVRSQISRNHQKYASAMPMPVQITSPHSFIVYTSPYVIPLPSLLSHFFRPLAPVDVIFDVDIRSPMYFCRNLLLLSSLSCSSFTASMRLKISRRDCWRTFACLRPSISQKIPFPLYVWV